MSDIYIILQGYNFMLIFVKKKQLTVYKLFIYGFILSPKIFSRGFINFCIHYNLVRHITKK